MARWYFRCPDCLAVAAVDADKNPGNVECSLCQVRMEPMGRVSKPLGLLVRDEERCPCDERCTCANGPSCSCKCGGKNHGSGLVVPFERVTGKIPQLRPPDPRAPARRDEWRRALEHAKEADPGRDQAARKAAGEYLSPGDFARYLEHRRWIKELARIRGLRSHHGRMAALARLAGKPPVAPTPVPERWTAPSTAEEHDDGETIRRTWTEDPIGAALKRKEGTTAPTGAQLELL